MRIFSAIYEDISISMNLTILPIKNTCFPLASTADSGDHFEVTILVPVTISNHTLTGFREISFENIMNRRLVKA
jgi:hypothetical protein